MLNSNQHTSGSSLSTGVQWLPMLALKISCTVKLLELALCREARRMVRVCSFTTPLAYVVEMVLVGLSTTGLALVVEIVSLGAGVNPCCLCLEVDISLHHPEQEVLKFKRTVSCSA